MRKEIVDRCGFHRRHDRIGGVGAGFRDRLQIMRHRRIDAGLQAVRHLADDIEKALRPGARRVVEIPVEAFAERQSLGGFEPERIDDGDPQRHCGECLWAGDHAELFCLRDRVRHIGAGIREPDGVGFRLLRARQVGREIRRIERVASPADDLAAFCGHDLGGVALEIVAKIVVDGDEEPGLEAAVDQSGADRVPNRIGVEDIVNRCRGAALVGQALRAGRAQRHDLMAGVADPLHNQRLGRTADVEDRIDPLVLEPIARDRGGTVDAVVRILDEQLDRRAEHLLAEIVDRHFAGRGAALAGIRRIRTGEVENQPDPHDTIGNLRRKRAGQEGTQCNRHRGGRSQQRLQDKPSPDQHCPSLLARHPRA